MAYTPDDYHYTVEWSEDDKAFVGRAKEFEFLAADGQTYSAALAEIKKVVGYVLEDMEKDGDPIPVPQN